MDFTESIIKNRKLKLTLRIICFLLIFPPLVINFGGWTYFIISELLGFSLYLINTILITRPNDRAIRLFLLIFIGFFFKRNHLPPAGMILVAGTFLLGILSLRNTGRFLITFPKNPFIKMFGSLSGIIISLFMTGLLFMNQHWAGIPRVIFIYSGSFLFVLFTLGIIFTLPYSNYIAWSESDRKVFFRTILLPMVFVFALITLIFVFPDTYNSILGRGVVGSPWFNDLSGINLFDLEGIPAI